MKLQQALATVAIAVVAILGAVPGLAQTQDYPSKTITLVVPFPPGGGNDAMARIMADRLSAGLGKTVIVENRGGGGGIIGTRSAAKAAPDGYTLMLGHTGSIGINPTLYANSGIDPRKDFTALGLIATMPLVLLTHPSVKANTIGELIALAKKAPGKINLGSSSKGTGSHMCAEMFMAEAQVSMNLIPYKGTGQLVTDLVGGHVQVSFGVIPPAYGNIKAGNLRAIAVTSPKRTRAAAGRADRDRIRTARLRGRAQLRPAGARRHAEGRSSTRSTRRCAWRSPTRRCASASPPTAPRRCRARRRNTRRSSIATSALVGADQEAQPEGRVIMKRSDSRILTTHTGSLPRPPDLVALLNSKELGEAYDRGVFDARIARAIAEMVRQQADAGIDVVDDGEHSKVNWMAYARGRLSGLEEIDSAGALSRRHPRLRRLRRTPTRT